MKAAVLDQPLSIGIQEVDMPQVKEDEALIKVHCIGVCGSDVHYYEHGRIGRYVVEKPIILGHELAGDVAAVGAKVKHLAIGDRVAVEPGIPCDRCEYCKSGRYNLCPDVVFMATPPVDGAWAEYVAVRADFLYKLPDTLSYEEGALLEPLSVGFHAMRRGKIGPGDRVLISGLGPIGLLAAVSAKMFGAGRVIGSDVIPFRRELALQMGIDAVIDPLHGNAADAMQDLTDGKGVTAIIETSGNAKAIGDAIRHVKFGGKIVYVGLPTTDQIPVDIPMLVDKELDVFGIFRYANTYPAAIEALAKGNYGIENVITHRYSLDEIKEACEVARTQKDKSIKVMIYPNGGEEK
ncbi:NAD(P)-dependent alcohol dehydrogenase [Fodinisporobacter ferrooxydans]|uniref:NAD(P)-dependent alcohol dehydrogenase n=1 Tax=Fodinisporobacter ferrooxydans TaxID=2901836 RepID=A0ABY4CU41_9BACL|nr:NAD(P)-dependent alcohol dehydrogenase [Alicyclobacillaceae bacterium MYW30-H2]